MKKILGFIICTMLITTTGFSVIGIEENDSKINDKYTKIRWLVNGHKAYQCAGGVKVL